MIDVVLAKIPCNKYLLSCPAAAYHGLLNTTICGRAGNSAPCQPPFTHAERSGLGMRLMEDLIPVVSGISKVHNESHVTLATFYGKFSAHE